MSDTQPYHAPEDRPARKPWLAYALVVIGLVAVALTTVALVAPALVREQSE